MRIVIFNWRDINHPWAGGSELNVHEMAKRWVVAGHTVTMVTAHYYGNRLQREKETIDGINIIRFGGRFSVYLCAPIYYLLRLRNKCDLVLDVENGIPFFTPLFVRKKIACLVNHVHKSVFFTEMHFPISYFGYFLETKAMPFIYRNVRFIVISETTREELRSIGIKNNRITTVYAGLDHTLYKPSLSEKYKDPTLIYLGRLRKYKRVNILIDIVNEVKKEIPSIKFIIAGDGDDKSNIESQIHNLNLGDTVKVKGFVTQEEKVELLQKSWIYLTASSIEGWGLSVIEANACGTPAISFKVPGLSEAIINNKSGYLSPTYSDLKEKVIELLQNEKRRVELTNGALQRAEQFDWNISARRFLESMTEIDNKIQTKDTYILGVHLSHNATASLLKNGKILGCVSEERFTRKKNQDGFPRQAINYLLRLENNTYDDLSYIVHAGHALTPGWVPVEDKQHPLKKYLFIVYYFMSVSPKIDLILRKFHYKGTKEPSKQKVINLFRSEYNIPEKKIIFAPHHHCHAYAAYFATIPIQEREKKRLVLTHDAEGDMLCGLVMIAQKGRLTKIHEIPAGNSIAAIYGSVTDLMGMKINEHEYKIMGLSPYTSKPETDKVYPLFDRLIKIDGSKINSMFGMRAGYMYLQRKLINKRFDGIAGAAQKMVEEKITTWIRNIIEKENIHSVVLGGGLFMNVKANKLIGEMSEVDELSICPSAADESNAIGAAYWGYEKFCDEYAKEFQAEPLDNLYLGPEFSDEEVRVEVSKLDKEKYEIEHVDKIELRIAKLLSEGHIIARMKGRSEFGARALGNRSIMADARNPDIIRVINEQIKSRDFWMPFASSILEERVNDYLVNPKNLKAPFMILAFDTTPLGALHLKAAIHPYDFTSRPQIVSKDASPSYYTILKEFEAITGVGGILNTSFNLHGEPVVLTPQDAIKTFINSGLKTVAIENYLITKKYETKKH